MNANQIRNEIATLLRQMNDWQIEGRLDSEAEAEIKGEISDLQGDLYDAEHPEQYAPTGAFNEALFFAAFGKTPEEEFGS